MMSIVWPIFWFGLIFSAITATVVIAWMEQSKRKKAISAVEAAQQRQPDDENLGESMEDLDSFPAEESFEFSELENK